MPRLVQLISFLQQQAFNFIFKRMFIAIILLLYEGFNVNEPPLARKGKGLTQNNHLSTWPSYLHMYSFVFLLHTLEAGAISIQSPQRSLTRSVQDDVFFSVDVTCNGVHTIQWTFMSGAVSRTIGTWQPGVYTNITVDYLSRVQSFDNGSMGLSDLRLQDAGYYVVTVAERGGSSQDAGFVLKVNGEWAWASANKRGTLLVKT